MSGKSLTESLTLQCPHGGSVTIVPSQSAAKADGSPIATFGDTATISGCSYQIPASPPIPSPCIRVQWIVPDVRVKAAGQPTLSETVTGLCFSANGLPQGPVQVSNTQQKVSSQ